MAEELDEEDLKFYENLFTSKQQDGEDELPEDFLTLNENLSQATTCKEASLQRLVSAECAEIQADELVALMAIYPDEMTVTDVKCKCFKVNLRKTENEDETIDIWFSIPINYPNDLPIFELEGHGLLSYKKADELYSELLEEACRMKHQTMIYTLVELAKEYLEKNVPRKPKGSGTNINPLADTVLQAKIQGDQLKTKGRIEEEKKLSSETTEGENDDNDDEDDDKKYYEYGHYKPTTFTGPIHNLMDKIPQHLQLVSIENILRADLAHRYVQCAKSFQKKYGDKARLRDKEYILTNTLGFHGTHSVNMGSIIRSGLKVPGTDGVSVAHGSAYGVGIYLSPDPTYSLSYSSDTKTLLVCSVLLGRCLKLGESGRLKRGSFDSVISPSGFEMVFFGAAQVLPCFVIKLAHKQQRDCNSATPQIQGAYASTIGKAERDEETQEEKLDRAKKRAAKYLPFGYGPSNKVLDVADSSDDEEDYGEYQKYRTGEEDDKFTFYY